MIIENQKIEVVWSNATIQKYTKLGYTFTQYGDSFFVDLKDIDTKARKKVRCICDYCGKEYQVQYYAYTYGRQTYPTDACEKCKGKKRSESTLKRRQAEAYEDILQIAKSKDYEILSKQDEYVDQSTRLYYKCHKHGIQNMSVANFRRGYGCPKCAIERSADAKRLSIDEVISIIESVDGNKLLNPMEYKNNQIRNLRVLCSCGNEFKISLGDYYKTFRCKQCSRAESYGELLIRLYLEQNNIEFILQHKFDDCVDKKRLPFDFYLPTMNICIEFDGRQHFEPGAFGLESFNLTQKHDRMKNEYCKNNNIKLIRIKYTDIEKIDEILNNELKTM